LFLSLYLLWVRKSELSQVRRVFPFSDHIEP
jgi:hypothetical protein